MDLDRRVALAPTSRANKVEVEDLFAKFYVGSFIDLTDLYAGKPAWGTEQKLIPRDLALLLVLMQQVHPMTGRIHCSVSEIARKTEKSREAISTSLSRLKKARLVVNTRDKATGALYMVVNPSLLAVGNEGRRTKATALFYELLEKEVA